MSLGYFISPEAISGHKKDSLFVFLSALVTRTLAVTHQNGLWGRYHPAVLEKPHSFSCWPLILATLEERSDILKVRPQAGNMSSSSEANSTLSWEKKKNVHFLLRLSELSKSPLLPFWLANVASDLNGTPAGSLMTKPTRLNFCYLWNF